MARIIRPTESASMSVREEDNRVSLLQPTVMTTVALDAGIQAIKGMRSTPSSAAHRALQPVCAAHQTASTSRPRLGPDWLHRGPMQEVRGFLRTHVARHPSPLVHAQAAGVPSWH